jgi:hypothetical protein
MDHRVRARGIAAFVTGALALGLLGAAPPRVEPVLRSHAERLTAAAGNEQALIVTNQRQRAAARWTLGVAVYRQRFTAAVYAAKLLEARRAEAAEQARESRHRATTTRRTGPSRSAVAVQQSSGSGQCGGDLPPCYVMMRESRGDIRAENPVSTASGKWQFLDSTWGGYGGYSHAADAPESVQDARAREVWAGGAGASNWACC